MKKIIVLTYATALCLCAKMDAQVGINTENPNPLANLEVKNAVTGNGDTVFRGVMIPRMTEVQRNRINVTNDSVANSLMIYNIDEDCFNYYMKADKKWKSICGTEGRADFEIICSPDADSVQIHGTYTQNVSMNTSNYLTVTVNVKKTGTWMIMATTATSNGFSFFATGIFTATGKQIVQIPATGKPEYSSVKIDAKTPDPGLGKLIVRTVSEDCDASIEVLPQEAEYSLFCQASTVYGTYKKAKSLTSAEKITVRVTVLSAGSYHIYTGKINGISFSRQGIFLASDVNTTIDIDLYGEGKPTVNLDFPIEIEANTPTSEINCIVTIPVTMPKLYYATIGSENSDYTWGGDTRQTPFAVNSPAFGRQGVLRVDTIERLFRTSNVTTAAGYLNNGYKGKKPDVVLYFSYSATPNADIISALVNYVNAGGCLMFSPASARPTNNDPTSGNDRDQITRTNDLMEGIFGSAYRNAVRQYRALNVENNNKVDFSKTTDDACYQILDKPSDPVIDGPFGYLGNKYWCEDNDSEGTTVMKALPPGSVQVCSAYDFYSKPGVDPSWSVVWYNDAKNFVYFGDTNGATTTSTDPNNWPSYYTPNGMPRAKLYGNWSMDNSFRQMSYASYLELNAVAWLFKKAVLSGINPH